MSWSVWLVIFAVLRWTVVLVCIYSKQCEVSGMSWPSPVVSIRTEFSNRRWWSGNQANVFKYFYDKKHVLVPFVESTYSSILPRFFLRFSSYFLHIIFNQLASSFFISNCFGSR